MTRRRVPTETNTTVRDGRFKGRLFKYHPSTIFLSTMINTKGKVFIRVTKGTSYRSKGLQTQVERGCEFPCL